MESDAWCYQHTGPSKFVNNTRHSISKRDIGRKSWFLYQSKGPSHNIAVRFGMEKLEWRGYPTVRICLLVLTQYLNVTDTRQTDRHCIARQKLAKLLSWMTSYSFQRLLHNVIFKVCLDVNCITEHHNINITNHMLS